MNSVNAVPNSLICQRQNSIQMIILKKNSNPKLIISFVFMETSSPKEEAPSLPRAIENSILFKHTHSD
jgi:hypothetical protein